jgi:2-haloacid dehalogenase
MTNRSAPSSTSVQPSGVDGARFRAVVFDFGGVLVDWDPRYLYRKLIEDEAAMERFLDDVDFYGWNLEQDRGRPLAEGVALLSRSFPSYAELIAAYHERWEESISGPIEGTVQILREVRDAGYPLYGLSNWSAETFERIQGQFPFFTWFERIVLSGVVQAVKPDARIYRALLEQSGRSPDECVFIDDSLVNVSAAEALGFEAIRFESPDRLRRDLVARGILH